MATEKELDYLRQALVKLREADDLISCFGRSELGGWDHTCIYTAGALEAVMEDVEWKINACPGCGDPLKDHPNSIPCS